MTRYAIVNADYTAEYAGMAKTSGKPIFVPIETPHKGKRYNTIGGALKALENIPYARIIETLL